MNKPRVILLVTLLIAVIVGFFFLPPRQWLIELEGYVQSLGTFGPVVVALAYVLCTVLLIPASIITVGAGTLFGLKTGFIVVIVGANLGAFCSFLLARTFLREKVARWARENSKFHFLDEAIGRQGFKMVLLTRLSPIFPFILLNYFLGLTAVRTGAYVTANFLGMLPAMFLLVYVGVAARDAIGGPTEASADFYQQIFKYVGLLATIGVVIIVTRIARRALREAEQNQSSQAAKPCFDPNYKPTAYQAMMLVDDAHDKRLIENCRPPRWVNPTPVGKYNLIVVGAGTAGLVSAGGAAILGAKVALIERNLMGGDCLNVGCVPSKGIIRAARAVFNSRNVAEFGVPSNSSSDMNFAVAMERMRRLRAEISSHDSTGRFAELGVDVYIGNGRFIGPSTIEVDGKFLEFTRAVIATGARATEPPIPGLVDAGYYTNETIFTLTELPHRMVVIGAGPVGCELAQCFQRFGCQVTMITNGAQILPKEDQDAAAIVQQQMIRDGVRIVMRGVIQRVISNESGKRVSVETDGTNREVECDTILVAVGRRPNLEGLELDTARVKHTSQGVVVDNRL